MNADEHKSGKAGINHEGTKALKRKVFLTAFVPSWLILLLIRVHLRSSVVSSPSSKTSSPVETLFNVSRRQTQNNGTPVRACRR
jgi:hypothetical protein